MTTYKPGRFAGLDVVSLLFGFLFLLSLLIYGPVDIEEYQQGIFSTKLHFTGLLSGYIPFWEFDMGFGTPLPIVHRFDLHPILSFLPLMSVRAALTLFWTAQLMVGLVFLAKLMDMFEVKGGARPLATVSYLFSSANTQWFYSDDWPTFVVGWTLLPALIYASARLIGASERREACEERQALTLGLALLIGFMVLNSHSGYLAVLFLCTAIFVLCHGRIVWRSFPWFAAAAALAIPMCGERLYTYIHEASLFPASFLRADVVQGPFSADRWLESFLRPFSHATLEWLLLRGQWPGWENLLDFPMTTRMPFLGVVLLGWALCGSFLRVAGRLKQWIPLPLAMAFLASLGMMFLPSSAFGNVASGIWFFRDPMTLFAVLIGAIAVSRTFSSSGRRYRKVIWALVFVQTAQVVLGTLGAHHAVAKVAAQPGVSLYFYAGKPGERLLVPWLRAHISEAGGNRLVPTTKVHDAIGRRLAAHGVVTQSTLTLGGIDVVTGWFKGVTMDNFFPSRFFMHGFIGPQPQLLADLETLRVMGINMVLAFTDEAVAPGLRPIATFVSDVASPREEENPSTLVLYRVPGAWPQATLMNPAILQVHPPRKPECPHDGLLCRDLTDFSRYRLQETATSIRQHNGLVVSMPPEKTERLLFLNIAYRPEWRASSGNHGLDLAQIGNAFLGVRVPLGVETVTLTYEPPIRIALQWLSWVSSVGLCCLFAWSKWRFRCHPQGFAQVGQTTTVHD